MTRLYAVFGNPVAHSKSPFIHTEFARQSGQNIIYEAIRPELNRFPRALHTFIERGGCGANVTLPFKQEAFRFAANLTDRATRAEAVNTLTFTADQIIGDNTDGAGLVRDIRDNQAYPISGKRVLLMGAGGAARGVILPLLGENPTSLTVVNRTLDKAIALRSHFSDIEVSRYQDLAHKQFDLIINATSSGLNDELPPLPVDIFADKALAYEMMYGRITPFMTLACKQGARAVDGLGMLVEQAAESFYLWHGVHPKTQPIITQLRQ